MSEKIFSSTGGEGLTHTYVHMHKFAHVQYTCMNHIPLKNSRPRCYTESPTAQDVFRPIPTLVSCATVTGRWRLLSYTQNAVRYVADTHLLVRKSMKPGAAWRGSAYPGIINRRLFTNGRSREICSGNEHYYIYIQCMYIPH